MVAADRYDDGRTDVPGGLVGPVGRVVVVGAGIAGLTVANALTHGGVESVVVEARDRIGGRLHTIDLAGVPVDLGGSWIHHPVGNPMRLFAEQVGVSCSGGDALAGLGGFDLAEGRRLSAAEVEASIEMLYGAFPEAVERLRTELGPDASVAEAIESFVVAADLEPTAARRARQGLRAVIEAEAADLSERQSLRWIWNELEYGGGYFGDLPAGGYRGLVDAMASGVDVRLGFDAAEIVASEDDVQVRSTDGRIEVGSHVVVTVPLGVLKRGAPRFSPALPADRSAAIDRLGFGRLEKVALRFDEPFWRTAGLSHLMLFPRDPHESTTWVFDLDAFGAGPVLLFFVFHGAAGRVLDATPESASQWALGVLAESMGGTCPAPTDVAVTSWGNDPYSGGAYTHVPPGAAPADIDLLGEPVGGRILFAGEHTQSARVAYADGAMTSGIREAKRLLGRPDVRLGPHPRDRVPTSEALLTQLRADTASLVAQLRPADLDATVPSCPGWDVRRLVRHLGRVHRWATEVVHTGQEADAGRAPDGDDAALLDWFEQGTHDLVAALTAADPQAPCWTFGPDPQLAGFWIRRQAHETAVHRWDAGAALGTAAPIPDWLAEDGVDEVCRIMFPRQVRLARQAALEDALTLVSATSGRAWTLAGDGSTSRTAQPQATVTGPAGVLDLLLWHRTDLDDPRLTVAGDADAARRVLAAALTP